ncbi:MAG: hypothetical protein GXO07_04750 [Crenarchaeota archaeon]|nr:hypothetical protein [Thermoproteota archaeon]
MDSEEGLGGKVLVLTQCTKRKRRAPGPAKLVYSGSVKNLFLFSERVGAKCFIISAKYGLISCDEYIEPYDLYLKDLGLEEKASLRDALSSRCKEVEGPWLAAVVNTSREYSEVFGCKVRAEYALLIGKGARVEAEVVYQVTPKTLGERASLLKLLGGLKNVEDLLRLIEEGARNGRGYLHKRHRMGRHD